MKSERRISTPVLVGGMVLLLATGLVLWFGSRTPHRSATDSTFDSADHAAAAPSRARPVIPLEEVYPPPEQLLELRVCDTNGQSLAGVHVRAAYQRKDPDSALQPVTQSLTTDTAGQVRFAFAAPALERLELDAMAETGNYSGRSVTWDTRAGDVIPDSYTLTLPAGVRIGGVVVDEAGEPIAGARLEAVRPWLVGESMNRKGDEPGFTTRTVTTDDQGRWQMQGVTAELLDRLRFKVTHSDFLHVGFRVGTDPRAEQQLREGRLRFASEQQLREATHRLVLKRGVEVTIRVVDGSDRPISGATVWIGEISRQEQQTDATGRARFRNVMEGSIELSAIAPGHRPEERTVTVKAAMSEILVRLEPGRRLFGIVQDEAGQPLPNTRLTWGSLANGSLEYEMTMTGADGRFEWNGAPDEPSRINVYKSGYEQKRELRLYPDKENVVTLRKMRQVQGWVLDADTEKPITRFRVGVGPAAAAEQFRADHPGMREFANPSGAFTVALTEDATDAIKAEANDYSAKAATLPAARNGVVEVVLRLKPSAEMRAVVLGPDGAPMAGATVAVSSGGGSPRVSLENGQLQSRTRVRPVVTDAAGEFTIASPPQGGLVIAAAPVGFATVSIQQVRESGRVQLQAYGGIQGVFTVGGQPTAQQEFQYSSVDGDVTFTAQAITDGQGRFALAGIPPGEGEFVRLIRRSANSSQPSHNRRVVVQAGRITQVKLGDSGATLVGQVRFASPPAEGEKLTISGSMIPWYNSPAERQAVLNSPAWRSLDTQYSIVVAADGSFAVDSVLAGSYRLHVSARKSGDAASSETAFASGNTTITVPSGADPYSPIRLEEILLRSVPQPGRP